MTELARFSIAALGAQGDGVADDNGSVIHVSDALPGETVEREPDGNYRILRPFSLHRRTDPLCTHVMRCGGCAVQHMDDALYSEWKSGLLTSALSQHGLACSIAPLRSVPLGSRRRATLTGDWFDGEFKLGFHGRSSHRLEPINDCAVLASSIVTALPHLARLGETLVPSGKPLRMSVLSADNGLDIVLDQKPPRDVARNATRLASMMRLAKVIRLTCAGEPILQHEKPVITIAGVQITPPPGAFLQATNETDALLAEPMVKHIGKAKRVYDLFSGVGTLTFPVAIRARVTAVDGDAALLSALVDAASQTQGLKPITHLRRDLFRHPLSPLELNGADAVVLDPPRAGAAAQCESLARSKVGRVVMVSCNPATLARDLRILVDGGYSLERATPIDQFLFTHHLETVATLTRK